MNTAEVLDAFELLDNWEARYEFIGDLSRELQPLAEGERIDANLVRGCNTQTWLTGSLVGGSPEVIEFRADAETPLVRGLVALLLVPFQHQSPDVVLATDPGAFIDGLGLKEHLSGNRQAGMEHFIERLYAIARELGAATYT